MSTGNSWYEKKREYLNPVWKFTVQYIFEFHLLCVPVQYASREIFGKNSWRTFGAAHSLQIRLSTSSSVGSRHSPPSCEFACWMASSICSWFSFANVPVQDLVGASQRWPIEHRYQYKLFLKSRMRCSSETNCAYDALADMMSDTITMNKKYFIQPPEILSM